jgi:hypothetical protein
VSRSLSHKFSGNEKGFENRKQGVTSRFSRQWAITMSFTIIDNQIGGVFAMR